MGAAGAVAGVDRLGIGTGKRKGFFWFGIWIIVGVVKGGVGMMLGGDQLASELIGFDDAIAAAVLDVFVDADYGGVAFDAEMRVVEVDIHGWWKIIISVSNIFVILEIIL